MATLDTLCQKGTISVLNNYWWVVDGLTPGEAVQVRPVTTDETTPSGTYVNCFDGAASFGGTANADGMFVQGFNDVLATTYHFVTHDTGDSGRKSGDCRPPAVGRITNDWTLTVGTTFSSGTYVHPGSLAGTPGNESASLSWGPGSKCDSRGTIFYNVYRSTTSASSGFGTVSAQLLSESFADSGLNNGTTYWYKVQALIHLSTGYTVGGNDAVVPTNWSTVVSVIPVEGPASRELWGAIGL